MKKLLTSILAVALLLSASLLWLPAGAAGTGRIALSSGEAARGETFDMILSLEENPGLNTLQLEITYDTSALELVAVECTDALGVSAPNTDYASPYPITWVDFGAQNNTYTGTIAKFTFRPKGTTTCEEATVNVRVLSSYDVMQVKNEFAPATGKIAISGPLKGDTNGNGKVDSDDAIYLLYHALLGETRYPINQNCDFNGSGKVDSDDAIYLLYHALLGETRYPLN
ncbi:MAG: hypothetical protein IKJ74_03600 [Clostridia bacterium]|nr:hypothetical protein [Clostridia bacterium]